MFPQPPSRPPMPMPSSSPMPMVGGGMPPGMPPGMGGGMPPGMLGDQGGGAPDEAKVREVVGMLQNLLQQFYQKYPYLSQG